MGKEVYYLVDAFSLRGFVGRPEEVVQDQLMRKIGASCTSCAGCKHLEFRREISHYSLDERVGVRCNNSPEVEGDIRNCPDGKCFIRAGGKAVAFTPLPKPAITTVDWESIEMGKKASWPGMGLSAGESKISFGLNSLRPGMTTDDFRREYMTTFPSNSRDSGIAFVPPPKPVSRDVPKTVEETW